MNPGLSQYSSELLTTYRIIRTQQCLKTRGRKNAPSDRCTAESGAATKMSALGVLDCRVAHEINNPLTISFCRRSKRHGLSGKKFANIV